MTETGASGPRDTGFTSVGISAARAKVLARLREREQPWVIQDLAADLGLHRNTVREHLSALVDDRLAEFTEVRSEGPGRPARHYSATALGAGVDYLELATVLTEALADVPHAEQIAGQAGERWGERLVEQLASNRPDHDLVSSMTELGYSPTQLDDGTLELRSCPVLSAARRNPDIVCGIHAGMIKVLARPEYGEVKVVLEPWASETGCLARLQQVGD